MVQHRPNNETAAKVSTALRALVLMCFNIPIHPLALPTLSFHLLLVQTFWNAWSILFILFQDRTFQSSWDFLPYCGYQGHLQLPWPLWVFPSEATQAKSAALMSSTGVQWRGLGSPMINTPTQTPGKGGREGILFRPATLLLLLLCPSSSLSVSSLARWCLRVLGDE